MAKAFVKKTRESRVRSGHPWIFASDVEKVEGEFENGDVVDVVSWRGTFLGKAFYNPQSQISLRMLTMEDEPIDEAFFARRISIWELLSTFWGMYNMTPFAVLSVEALLLGVMELLHLVVPEMQTYLSFSSMFSFNMSSVLVMFYSIYVLFYAGDYLDNHRTPKLKEIFPVFVSIFINMFLGGFVNLIGLFLHRRQSKWVKTEHSISSLEM